jgi:hypothetical protein
MSGRDDDPQRLWPRRVRAMLAAILLFLALPMTAVAPGAAAPVTAGEVMRALYLAPDRKIDVSQKGVAAAPPPAMETVQIQRSTEPAAPVKTAAPAELPMFLVPRGSDRKRRRRTRRRAPAGRV